MFMDWRAQHYWESNLPQSDLDIQSFPIQTFADFVLKNAWAISKM